MATQEEKDKLLNLTGKNVSDTYGRILQKSNDNRVLDGGGNAPSLLVFPGDIYISGSVTAETTTTTVSESIILESTLSGSTKLGDSSDDFDVTQDLYQAAKMLIDNIDFKTNFDRSEGFAKQFLPVAVEFALLGMGFVSAEEALEYLQTE